MYFILNYLCQYHILSWSVFQSLDSRRNYPWLVFAFKKGKGTFSVLVVISNVINFYYFFDTFWQVFLSQNWVHDTAKLIKDN